MYGKCVVARVYPKTWPDFGKKLAEILPKKSLCSLHDRAFGDLCSRLRRSFPHILCNFSAFGALCLRSAAADVVVAALLRR